MEENEQKFATALNCIDGRVQKPVNAWVRQNFDVDFVDTITEPGIDKILSGGDPEYVREIKRFVTVSVNSHHSHMIVVAGHYGCAANHSEKEEHLHQIKKSVEVIKDWNLPATVTGLWVNRNWEIEVVC